MRHPEGTSPRGVVVDQALDRCLFFDYNDIKYGADRLLLNQQILWDREPSPVPQNQLNKFYKNTAKKAVGETFEWAAEYAMEKGAK